MEKRGERRGGDGATRLKDELFKTIAAAEMVKRNSIVQNENTLKIESVVWE